VDLSVIVCDLANPLFKRLKGNVDVLIFNPPYVPTDQQEASEATKNRRIESSWAGGLQGMSVTNRLLPQVEVRSPVVQLIP
jgi:release factor glutamine methyltransferase